MAKENPSSLILPPFKKITRTFSHYAGKKWSCSCGKQFDEDGPCPRFIEGEAHEVTENTPQKRFDITFKIMSQMEMMGIQGYLNEMYVKYVRGWGEKGKDGYKPPETLAPVGGKPVPMNAEVCQTACVLSKMQVGPEEDRYTFEEFCSWMMSDRICAEMLQASVDVQGDGDDENPLAKAV